MRRLQKFGKRIDLPSTAQIIHELKIMMSIDAVRAALGAAPEAERGEQIAVLETLLARPDIHIGASPEKGMEMLRRGARELELAGLVAAEGAAI